MVATAIAAAALAFSVTEQRAAGKAQKRSEEAGQRKADAAAARDRRNQVRQARIARAETIASAANTGAAGSSGEAGAISGIQSQLGANLGFSFQQQALSRQQSSANISAVKAGTRASIFGTISSFSTGFITPNAPKGGQGGLRQPGGQTNLFQGFQ